MFKLRSTEHKQKQILDEDGVNDLQASMHQASAYNTMTTVPWSSDIHARICQVSCDYKLWRTAIHGHHLPGTTSEHGKACT